jgi:cobalamin synthase
MSPEVLMVAGVGAPSRASSRSHPLVCATRATAGSRPRLPVARRMVAARRARAGNCFAAVAMGWPGVASIAATIALDRSDGVRPQRLGGFTGDVLGASILVGETAGLVVASARW